MTSDSIEYPHNDKNIIMNASVAVSPSSLKHIYAHQPQLTNDEDDDNDVDAADPSTGNSNINVIMLHTATAATATVGADTRPLDATVVSMTAATSTAKFMDSPKYRTYVSSIDKALRSFDSSREWADLISFLGRLLKVLEANADIDVVPRKLILAKRLSQCLNPSLPSGVHLKAVEAYELVFSNIGSDRLAADLFLYSVGLFPLFQYASITVKPALLALYEKYYLPLGGKLLPCLDGLLISILPGSDDDGENSDRVMALLNSLMNTTESSVFFHSLWKCIINSHAVRLPALNFLSMVLRIETAKATDSSLPELRVAVLGDDIPLAVAGFVTALEDQTVLVQRCVLDIMVAYFPINCGMFSSHEVLMLLGAALPVFLRRDMSLNRRFYNYLFGPSRSTDLMTINNDLNDCGNDDNTETSTYFHRHVYDLLALEMKNMFFKLPDNRTEALKPYKILLAGLERTELASLVAQHVIVAMARSLLRLSSCNFPFFEDVVRSANALLSQLDPDVLWSALDAHVEFFLNVSRWNSDVADGKDGDVDVDLMVLIYFLLENTSLNCHNEAQTNRLPSLLRHILVLTLNVGADAPLSVIIEVMAVVDRILNVLPPVELESMPPSNYAALVLECRDHFCGFFSIFIRNCISLNNECSDENRDDLSLEKAFTSVCSVFQSFSAFPCFLLKGVDTAVTPVNTEESAAEKVDHAKILSGKYHHNGIPYAEEHFKYIFGNGDAFVGRNSAIRGDSLEDTSMDTIPLPEWLTVLATCATLLQHIPTLLVAIDTFLCALRASDILNGANVNIPLRRAYLSMPGYTDGSISACCSYTGAAVPIRNRSKRSASLLSQVSSLVSDSTTIAGKTKLPATTVALLDFSKWTLLLKPYLETIATRLWDIITSSSVEVCEQVAKLFLKLHEISQYPVCENVIGTSLTTFDSDRRLEAHRRFALFWQMLHCAADDGTSSLVLLRRPFSGAMLVMLDSLQASDPALRQVGRSWLVDAIGDVPTLLEPLLFILLRPVTTRGLRSSTTAISVPIYRHVIDAPRVTYAMEAIASMISCEPDTFLEAVCSSCVRSDDIVALLARQDESLMEFTAELPRRSASLNFLDLLIATLLRYAVTQPPSCATSKQVAMNANVQVLSVSVLCSLLGSPQVMNSFSLLSQGGAHRVSSESTAVVAALVPHLVTLQATALRRLYASVIDRDHELQVELLRLVLRIISLSNGGVMQLAIPGAGMPHPQNMTSEVNDSSSAGHITHFPAVLMVASNPIFLKVIIKALSDPELHSIHACWIKFVVSTLPYLHNSLTSVIAAVVTCCCDILDALCISPNTFVHLNQSPMYPDVLLKGIYQLVRYNLESAFDSTCGDELGVHSSAKATVLTLLPRIWSTLLHLWTVNTESSVSTVTNPLSHNFSFCRTEVSPSLNARKTEIRCDIYTLLSITNELYPENFLSAAIEVWKGVGDHFASSEPGVGVAHAVGIQIAMISVLDGLSSVDCNTILSSSVKVLEHLTRSGLDAVETEASDAIMILGRNKHSQACVFHFLHEYIRLTTHVTGLKSCWPAFLSLYKDAPLSSHPPTIALALAGIHGFVKRVSSSIFDTKRQRRDLQDVTSRLCDVLGQTIASVGVSSVDVPELAHTNTGLNDVKLVLHILSHQLLALLDKVFGGDEKDRITTLLIPMVNALVPHLMNGEATWSLYSPAVNLLASLCNFPHTLRAWARSTVDLLLGPSFFIMLPDHMVKWRHIIDDLMSFDKSCFSILLDRTTISPSLTNLFTTREKETREQAGLLKRISFVIFCGAHDQYLRFLPTIQEKLVESFKLEDSPTMTAEAFRCMRVLFMRLSPSALTSLWPIALAEIVQVLQDLAQTLGSGDPESTSLMNHRNGAGSFCTDDIYFSSGKLEALVSVCRFLDLVLCVPSEQFSLFEWAFVSPLQNVVENTSTTRSSLSSFIPYLLEISSVLAKLKRTNAADNSENVECNNGNNDVYVKQPLLIATRIRSVHDIEPWFRVIARKIYNDKITMGTINATCIDDWLAAEFIDESSSSSI